LIEGGWELVEAILAEIPNEPTAKLFPYNSKTCSQRKRSRRRSCRRSTRISSKTCACMISARTASPSLLKKGYTALQVKQGLVALDHKDDRHGIRASDRG
jgi:hypothetical protein